MFPVNKQSFYSSSSISERKTLIKRPEQEKFLDSIVFGVIVSNKINLKSFKTRVRKQLYEIWNRSYTYIKVHSVNLSGKESVDQKTSVFR